MRVPNHVPGGRAKLQWSIGLRRFEKVLRLISLVVFLVDRETD